MTRYEYLTDEELKELSYRASGRTTRIVDELVQEFFNKPFGTKILVCDHYGTRQADEHVLRKLCKRIEAEHHVKYHIIHEGGLLYIVRDDPTLQEMVLEEIKRRKEK
jgi:hypothetical protein